MKLSEVYAGNSIARSGYGCSRSSDSLFIALAEELTKTYTVEILTFDKDYGEIVYRNEFQNSPAIVFFRFKGYDSLFAGNTLIKLIEDSTISIENCFTVVEEETIRQRKL